MTAGWGHDPTWRRSGSCPRSAVDDESPCARHAEHEPRWRSQTGPHRRQVPVLLFIVPTVPKARSSPCDWSANHTPLAAAGRTKAPVLASQRCTPMDTDTDRRRTDTTNRICRRSSHCPRTRPANRASKARCFGPRIRTANMTADRTCGYPKNVCAVFPRVCSIAVRNEAEVVTSCETGRIYRFN